jgi:hypothetical protein
MKKITLIALLLLTKLTFATTYYVNADAQGNNSGTSWANAFTNLQSAINATVSGDILFVKSGTYYPSQQMISGNTRSRSFYINKNIKIYGGFNGTESTIGERNFTNNITILSGDFNGNDTDTNGNGINDFGQGENAYTVVTAYNLDNTALIDGFRIFGGNADGSATYTLGSYSITTANGGAIHNIASSLVVRNTRFINNSASFGGGITNKGACFPKIEFCDFIYNYAAYGNSIHVNDASLATVNNCTFTSNRGSGVFSALNNSVYKATNCTFTYNQGTYGGVIYNNNGCSTVLMNCNINNNTASSSGGAVYLSNYSVCTMYNTLVYKNAAIYGGGVYNTDNSYTNCINSTFWGNNASTKGGAFYCSVSPDNMFMKLYNTIIYGNTSPTNPNWFKEYFTTSNIHVRNSIIQGSGGSAAWNTFYGTNDGNNMDVNPQFTSTTQDQENFTLLASSPGIDASYNQQLNLPNTNNSWTANDTDVYGNSRLVGNGVDLGAVEKGQSLSIIEVNPKVSFYSNNGILYFDDLSVVINKTITVYDLNGKAVYSTKLETNQTSLPKLATGVYILQVENLKGIKFLVH